MKKIILLSLMALVCLISTDAWADENSQYNGIHKIAVISALGDDIVMQTYGETRFDSAQYTLHTDWKIDSDVQHRLADVLSTRFQVVATSIDAKTLFDFSSGFFDNSLDQLQKRIQALPKSNGVDAYVIVFPQRRSLAGESWRGLQVTLDNGWFGRSNVTVSAYYVIGVFNATTGQQIDYGTAKYAANGFIGGTSNPFVFCSTDIWADKAETLSESQKDQINEEFISLIDKGMLGALVSAHTMSKDEADAYERSHPTPPNVPACHQI